MPRLRVGAVLRPNARAVRAVLSVMSNQSHRGWGGLAVRIDGTLITPKPRTFLRRSGGGGCPTRRVVVRGVVFGGKHVERLHALDASTIVPRVAFLAFLVHFRQAPRRGELARLHLRVANVQIVPLAFVQFEKRPQVLRQIIFRCVVEHAQ